MIQFVFYNMIQYTNMKWSCIHHGRNEGGTYTAPGMILVLGPANERRRYIVTTSLIGWV